MAKELQYEFYYVDNRVYTSSSGGKEKRILGKELIISKQNIFNLQSDIVKRWREGVNEKNKIIILKSGLWSWLQYYLIWV